MIVCKLAAKIDILLKVIKYILKIQLATLILNFVIDV